MKICLIMAGDEEGGLENHVMDLANALAGKHEVHLIAHAKYARRLSAAVYFHPVDLSRGRRNPLVLLRVAALMRAVAPDIIHAQANKAASIIDSLKPFLPRHSRRVATLHSLKRNLKAYESFDWVIGVSQSVLQGLDNPHKSVIYNGVKINPERIRTRRYLLDELALPPQALIMAALGRLVPVKRFDLLVEAFQGVQDAHLLIVGEGEERQNLEKQIAQPAARNIHLLGNRVDNLEILSAADLCVISSEREGFSYVMAESLLVNTPVISTAVADMKNILPAQAVVAVNDAAAMHNALADICADYESFSQLFQPVYLWAEQHFQFARMAHQTEQIYRKLVGGLS